MLTKPTIPEICEGELKDYILELIQKDLKNIPDNMFSRRKDIATALLACNKAVGKREKLKEELCKIVQKISFSDVQEHRLSQIGFRIIKGKGHYKLCWGESPYRVVFSATPSDWRFSLKTKTDINKTFF